MPLLFKFTDNNEHLAKALAQADAIVVANNVSYDILELMDLSNIVIDVKNLITKRNLVIISAVFLLSVTLSFGLGFLIANGMNQAPIIIQQGK